MFACRQKAPDITREALEESNPLSEEAVDLFLAIIGAEAGYMGVRALASGGIYICGGITPRVGALADVLGAGSSYFCGTSQDGDASMQN